MQASLKIERRPAVLFRHGHWQGRIAVTKHDFLTFKLYLQTSIPLLALFFQDDLPPLHFVPVRLSVFARVPCLLQLWTFVGVQFSVQSCGTLLSSRRFAFAVTQ